MIACCTACDKPIMDKFLMNVLERTWHADCVRCCDCRTHLTDKCFSREGKLYCRDDFFRRYGTKCAGCGEGISPQDLVRKARDKVFHLKCFTCLVCRKQLSTGEQLYVLDESRFICKDDYVSGKNQPDSLIHGEEDEDDDEMPQSGSDVLLTTGGASVDLDLVKVESVGGGRMPGRLSSGALTAPTTPLAGIDSSGGAEKMSVTTANDPDVDRHDSDAGSDGECGGSGGGDGAIDGKGLDDDKVGGNKRRGPRTTIKAKQLEVLKAAFNSTPKPTRHIREQLAKETGLPMRVIQVWFQNKRSKERRMKQLSSMGMRAHLFGNPRKLRGMRMSPSMDEFPFYGGDPHFYGHQPFSEFFPGAPGAAMAFGPPGVPVSMEQPLPAGGPPMADFVPMPAGPMVMEHAFMPHPAGPPPGAAVTTPAVSAACVDLMSQRSSPDQSVNMPPISAGVSVSGNMSFSDHQNSEGLVW